MNFRLPKVGTEFNVLLNMQFNIVGNVTISQLMVCFEVQKQDLRDKAALVNAFSLILFLNTLSPNP